MSDLIEIHLSHLRAAGYSVRTVRARYWVLRRIEADVDGGVATPLPSGLETWLGRAGWSRWTRYTYWEHLNGFYAWAVRRGHLDWNPMDATTRPRPPACEPRPATEDELVLALTLPRPWRAAVILAAFAGLRCAEIAGLIREAVTADWLSVERKGGLTQILPTHALVWEEISARPPGLLVPTPHGTRYWPSHLSAVASAQLTSIGLAGVTLHRFRHRFATRLLTPVEHGGAGADIRTVQELMGHRSVASTQIYTQVVGLHRRAAIAGLVVPGA